MIGVIDTDLEYVISGRAVQKVTDAIKLLDIKKLKFNEQLDLADRLRTVVEEVYPK